MSWLFTASSTTSPALTPASAAVATAGTASRRSPSASARIRPSARIASRWPPRATRVTSTPAPQDGHRCPRRWRRSRRRCTAWRGCPGPADQTFSRTFSTADTSRPSPSSTDSSIDHPVVDDRRVTLGAHPEPTAGQIDLEAHGPGEVGRAVGQQEHRLAHGAGVAPCAQDEGVVDRHARNGVDAFGFQLVRPQDVPGKVKVRARRREGAGDREQHHLPVPKHLTGLHRLGPVGRRDHDLHIRDPVAYSDACGAHDVSSNGKGRVPTGGQTTGR